MKTFRKATALLLTLAMLMACLPAWATESAGSGEDKKIEGSVIETTVAPNDATAVQVSATGSGDASMTVTEGVSALVDLNAAEDSAKATGAEVKADNGNTATLDVAESITAETKPDISGAFSVVVEVGENSTVNLNAETIEATAHGELSSAEGLDLSNNPHGTIKVETDGISATVKGEAAPALGVYIEDQKESKTEVTVGKGGIISTATEKEGSATAVDAVISGDIVFTSEGDITASSADSAAGVIISVYDGGSASVSTDGKLSAKTEAENSTATAAELNADTGSSITLKAGSITAETEADNTMATAADLKAGESSSITLEAGSITAETHADIAGAFGAFVEVGENGTVNLNAETIEATAHGELSSAEGLDLSNNPHGTIKVETDGISATVKGVAAPALGVYIEDQKESKTEVTVGKGGIISTATEKEGSATAVDAVISGDAVLTSEGDIAAKSADSAAGVIISVYDGGSASVSTDEKLSAETQAEGTHTTAADLNAGASSSITLKAGSIEAIAQGDNSSVEDVFLRNEASGTISVTADGISATNNGNGGYARGVFFRDLNEGGTVEINAGQDGINATANGENTNVWAVGGDIYGNVTVNSDSDITASSANEKGGSAYAIRTYINDGSSLTVRVSGGVQATAKGEDSDATAINVGLRGGKAEITVDQDVSAAGGDTAMGISAETYNATTADISIGGDVTAKDAQTAFAIDVSGTSGTINVRAGGDISAISDGYAAIGVNTSSGNEEDITVNVEGSVSASANALDDGHGYATGIQAIANHNDDKITITVGDGVRAETAGNSDMATGIFARSGDEFSKNESGKIDIQVVGDVESSGTGIQVTGTERDYMLKTTTVVESEYDHSEYIMVEGAGVYEEKIYYNAEGDYYYGESGEMWQLPEDTGSGLTRIEVRGDVTAGNIGLDVSGEVPADVIIDGTLSGENHAVVLSQETVADNLTLTVWEIKPNEDGSVAEYGRIDKSGELQTTEATDVEKEIQYIIRMEQPQAGGTIYTEGTFDYEGYTVAHESDTVVLKVSLQPGYEILDAYNGTDTKMSLLKDADGNYYLVVPRGGAVLLSVNLRKSEAEREEKERKEAEIEEIEVAGTAAKKQTNAVQQVTVTIDPNGGTLNGSTAPVVVEVAKGQSITLPEAPEKAGSTFLGWYGTLFAADSADWKAPEEGSDELLEAGSTVLVTCDYFYTAVWNAE